MVAAHDDFHVPGVVRAVAVDEFMQHTAIEPAQPVADELLALVVQRAVADVDGVAILAEQRQTEIGGQFERVIGVNDQRIVAMRPRQVERLGAVVGKVLPRALVKLAWQTGEFPPDDVLRTIGGAGVDDHPVGNERPDAGDAARNHRCLVPDDHAQADGLADRPGIAVRLNHRNLLSARRVRRLGQLGTAGSDVPPTGSIKC